MDAFNVNNKRRTPVFSPSTFSTLLPGIHFDFLCQCVCTLSWPVCGRHALAGRFIASEIHVFSTDYARFTPFSKQGLVQAAE